MRPTPRLLPTLPAMLGIVLPAADLFGQGTSQEELIARKAAALDKAFCHAANWQTDFSAAKAEARRTGRPIFAYFSRSYWP